MAILIVITCLSSMAVPECIERRAVDSWRSRQVMPDDCDKLAKKFVAIVPTTDRSYVKLWCERQEPLT